jgi:hypothetical protein
MVQNPTQILIPNGKYDTREKIHAYYMKHIDDLYIWTHDRRVNVVCYTDNKYVTHKTYPNSDQKIKITRRLGIDNPRALEYYINRDAVEFHLAATTTTDLIWITIDTYNSITRKQINKKMREIIEDVLTSPFSVYERRGYRKQTDGINFWPITDGINVTFGLRKPMSTTKIRKILVKEFLNAKANNIFPMNFKLVFESNKNNSTHEEFYKNTDVGINVTEMVSNGSVLSPYSLQL